MADLDVQTPGVTGGAPEGRVQPPPKPPARVRRPPSRRKVIRLTLLILGPVLVLVAIGYFWLTGGRWVSTDNAYVQADTVNVATDVSGLVAQVDVKDNERVQKGQELFRLDDSIYRATLDEATAQVGVVADQLRAQQASWRQMRAQIAQAKTTVEYNQVQYKRQVDLVARHFSPQSELDSRRHDLDVSQQQVTALEAQQAGIVAQLDGDPEGPIESHPRYKAAEAARARAARDLAHTVVRASMDGVVTNVDALQPGEYLPAGQAAFALVAIDHVWIDANPKETDLTHVAPGQPVEVSVDTYPGVDFKGTVASVSPGSQAMFSLLPAQNASGNWVKVVQRIPVRIRVDIQPGQPQLRAGMSTEIAIDTGVHRSLAKLIAGLFGHDAG
jgi:membrane fusion protein (multidrug efflux system)